MNQPTSARLRMRACRGTRPRSANSSTENFPLSPLDHPLNLPAEIAAALADVLPLLMCGEASAEALFAVLAQELANQLTLEECSALRQIGIDEQRHGTLLDAVQSHLPALNDTQVGRRATAFLRSLHTDDYACQLTRVAALDAAVCRILIAMLRPSAALSASPFITQTFSSIHADEGRHVRVARDCARRLGLDSAREQAERAYVWQHFHAMLLPADAQLRLLGVDLQRIFSLRNEVNAEASAKVSAEVGASRVAVVN